MLTDLREVLSTLELIPPPPHRPRLIPPPAFNHPENQPGQDLLELGKNIHLKYMYMHTQHIYTYCLTYSESCTPPWLAEVSAGTSVPWARPLPTMPLLAVCCGLVARLPEGKVWSSSRQRRETPQTL